MPPHSLPPILAAPRSRRVGWRVAAFAALHFLALKAADFALHILTHLPPVVFPIDPVINAALVGFRILYFPRNQLRALWPGDATPAGLNFLTALAASLAWGTAIHALLAWRTRVRTAAGNPALRRLPRST